MDLFDQYRIFSNEPESEFPLGDTDYGFDFASYSDKNGFELPAQDAEPTEQHQPNPFDSPALTIESTESTQISSYSYDQQWAFKPLEGFEQLCQNWEIDRTVFSSSADIEHNYLNFPPDQDVETQKANYEPASNPTAIKEKIVEKRKRLSLDSKKTGSNGSETKGSLHARRPSLSPVKSFRYRSKSLIGASSNSGSPTNPFYKPPDILWKYCDPGSSIRRK
ncbi:hypothetical protein KL921_000733 [Ogataea angusta]|uniref:Uncharacterized protein n=1 Tax=Pichia angusta TaxID=870730 RepID=A0ABQ7S4A5_PICAN|nr:hypothetical protein KL921_000733 [Ogataea angusta]KAG7843009.1 hypothetical protein KL942_000105 [Ogataea angusta]KAG7852839.1 hypothetical protein KL940_000540 [Ogataea angusta]